MQNSPMHSMKCQPVPMTTNVEFSEYDRQMMMAALALAERGRYTCMPNPRVGCVIVKGDDIVGRGAHLHAGQPHAEVLALQEAGAASHNATVYVTLEPCDFHGRTGPCTQRLIAAGVSRVIYALDDANPKVSGQGRKALLAAGIVVDFGLLACEAQQLNRGFFSRMQTQRPFVHAKMAMSLDGRTAMASGESQWITGGLARSRVQEMRAQSCVMVTGIGTVLSDDPSLTVRSAELGVDIGRQPALVVIDSHLNIPLDSKVICESTSSGRALLIACAKDFDIERKKALVELGVEVQVFTGIVASPKRIDLSALLDFLGEREYNEVMLEAGAELLGSFIQQQLVDELSLFVAPKLLGASAKPLAQLHIEAMSDAQALDVIEVESVGDDWLFRCKLVPQALTH